MGACCICNDPTCLVRECADAPTAADCESLGRQRYGSTYFPGCQCGTTAFCDRYACCLPREGYICLQLGIQECIGRDGIFGSYDDGTLSRCCAEVRCDFQEGWGACCQADGSCADGVPEYECTGDVDFPGYFYNLHNCDGHIVGEMPTIDCGDPDPVGACCNVDGACTELSETDCAAQGTWQGVGVQCEVANCPQPNDTTCRKAHTAAEAEALSNTGIYHRQNLKWTTDLCGLGIFAPTIRNSRHYPKSPYAQGWTSKSLFEPVSIQPIRAMEPAFTVNDSEPCRYHFGGIVKLPNGTFAPAMCGQVFFGRAESIEVSIGAVAIQSKPDPQGVRKMGEFYWVMSYHMPYWTEAEMFSAQAYCTIPI